jgi:hypothetical protein
MKRHFQAWMPPRGIDTFADVDPRRDRLELAQSRFTPRLMDRRPLEWNEESGSTQW